MKIKKLFSDSPASRYNVAVWQKADEDHIVLCGRDVESAAKPGEPDFGKLFLAEMDSDYNIIHERIIWEPVSKSFLLEDPRALVLANKTILIGLTAVLREPDGYTPFPALVRIPSYNIWKEQLPPVTIIQTFGPGKNLTPISAYKFLFRPEDPEYFHKLLLFSSREINPRKIQDINFPTDVLWAKWRIGTTIPPIWINPKEALLIIHGISIVNNKYVYSIGKAKLYKKNGKFEVVTCSEAILTPDSFTNLKGNSMVEELHPYERRVVYATGGIIKRQEPDTFYLYVNVGDRATFEVGISKKELYKGLF